MHIAICDDRRTAAEKLAAMIGGEHTSMVFSSAEELLFHVEEWPFDLFLLDIFLGWGDRSGLELARIIRDRNEEALICFISSSRECYADAFALYAFQYLVKPVEPEAFQKMLSRAARQLDRHRERSLRLTWRGRSISMPYSRILFISSQGHTLSVFCRDGGIEKHVGQLSQMEEILDSRIFARCHQSYLVNLYNVSSLSGSEFTCEGQRVPISRRYAEVKERYRKLLFEDME